MNRQCAKNLLKSLDKYDSIKTLVKKAVDPTRPSLVKSHPKNRANLDEAFSELFHSFRTFKRELNIEETEFNGYEENGTAKYSNNDQWFEAIQENYYELIELSDDKLEAQVESRDPTEVQAKEEKVIADAATKERKEEKLVQELGDQLDSFTTAISSSILKISSEVSMLVDGGESVTLVQAFKADLAAVEDKIDVKFQNIYQEYVSFLDEVETKEKKLGKDGFVNVEKAKFDNLLIILNKKVKAAPTPATAQPLFKKTETYLKKIEPPDFKGDIVEYADFVRKWKAQVGCAGLSAESELDRLRDHVPGQAAKALYGETAMAGAWKVLDKLYGDKDLVANKLKIQLKSIKPKGRKNQDIIIDLVTDVNNIVLRLKTLQLEQMLIVDSEFLSSIYRVLPSSSQKDWLDFDKDVYSSKWEAFMKFLDKERDRALQSKVLLSSYEQDDAEKVTCSKCGGSDHKYKNCTVVVKGNSVAASKAGDEGSEEDKDKKVGKLLRQQKEECGKCPLCSNYHTYIRKKDRTEWPTDRMFRCEKFVKMSLAERAAALEMHNCCPKCTSWHHGKADCSSSAKCSNYVNGKKCYGEHSIMVCGSGSAYCGSMRVAVSSSKRSELNDSTSSLSSSCSSTSSSNSLNTSLDISSSISPLSVSLDDSYPDVDAVTLLLFQDLNVLESDPARSCWDNGSTRVLVSHSYAVKNKLRSQQISFRLDVVGGKGEPQDGVLYELVLVENDGSQRRLWGFGVETIMEPPDPVDIKAVRHLFPHLPDAVFSPLPKKPIDLLIGNNFLQIHPDGGQGQDAVGDLKALHSRFGTGWVIAGSHPLLKLATSSLCSVAHCIAKVNKCEIVPESLPGFWEGDALGVLPPKRCNRCMTCSSCTDPALIHSRKEQDELEELEKNTKLCDDGIHVSYVFRKDPRCLPNNRATVVKIAAKQEQRLYKSGHIEFYNQEIQKYIDRGAAVKLSKEELEEWKGPINYISHHGVERPSPTTPLRIVTNSSLNNAGNSLNSCLIGGPNSLNPMLDIALRFRCHECGMVGDLTKAYNALKTGPVERNLRRFVWRFSTEEDWQDFAFNTVAFGDLPAANFLEIGRNMTADAGADIDQEASEKLKRDSYVDDFISGSSFEAVERMKGLKLGDGSFSGTMTKILDIGKLKAKTFISTGEVDEDAKALIGGKVLGYGWDASSDVMKVNFPIHLSNKKKKARMDPPLTLEAFQLLPKSKITKRICLGITNGFGDFLGLASPFSIRFKLLMKQLFDSGTKQLLWDDEVPDNARDGWIQLIAEAVETSSLCFPRAVRPDDAIGHPTIIGFSDGAFPAFASCIYIRWETSCKHGVGEDCDGDFVSTLLLAKAKVTPLSGYTVPRSELSGTVLMSRSALTTAKALNADSSMKPACVMMFTDSKCTISVTEKTAAALKPFFHNRVSEYIENVTMMKKICQVDDLFYVATDLNPADLATRGGVKLADIGPDSFWQLGPYFLRCRRDLWPVSRDFIPVEVPEDEIRTRRSFSFHLRVIISNIAVASECVQSTVQLWTDVEKEKMMLYSDSFLRAIIANVSVASVSVQSAVLLWTAVEKVMFYSNSFVKVKRIIARIIKGWSIRASDSPLTPTSLGEPAADELDQAERLMLLSAMPQTAKAYHEKKLDSLCPVMDGHIIATTGRLGEKSLSRLLGVSSLPILMPSSRAAYLFMVRAHEGEHQTEHKSIVETLARSRQSVWIVRARQLAKKVCSSCYVCKRLRIHLSGQLMAKLKEESLSVCRPWSFVSLDFAGPIKCKGAVNSRAKKKCWIVVYCCRSTKAVCLLATCGYDTAGFLLKHEEFVANHGAPVSIVSDRGSQLVSAGRILAEKESLADKESPGKWNWQEITAKNSASSWEFVPIGSQHFNGLPEATVKVLKKSLLLALHPGVELTYPELVTLLAKISYSINARPLGLSSVSNTSQQEDIMMPISPNMLLLGRSSDTSPPLIYSEDERFCTRLAYIAQLEQEWWDRWYKQVLPTLFTYKRWKKKQENLVVGDIVLLRYAGHFKDDYCLARVSEVHPDDEGLVRVVTVQFRKKNPRESKSVYRAKPLLSEKVAVHRLHRLDLADEAPVHEGVQGSLCEGDAIGAAHEIADEAPVHEGNQGDLSESDAVEAAHDI